MSQVSEAPVDAVMPGVTDGEQHEKPPRARLLTREGLLRRVMGWGAPHDREALTWWVLSRVAAVFIAAQAAWLFPRGDIPWLHAVDRWAQWDFEYYRAIAVWGYDGLPGYPHPWKFKAFFPGLPMLLRGVGHLVGDMGVAGLLISFVAGAVAIVALARITALDYGTKAAKLAPLLFVAAPVMVFMVPGYTEPLFLALALPAWLLARRGRWEYAAILAAGAACVRISGLFLAVALVVHFLAQWLPERLRGPALPENRSLKHAPWLVLPFLPTIAFFAYLKVITGDWGYWFYAQKKGWDREYHGFVGAFRETWQMAFDPTYDTNLRWAFRLEFVAVAIGLALLVYLIAKFRWAEATYIGITLVALMTSTMYYSVPRTALVWWPLWAALAGLAAHPRWGTWVLRVYLALSVPLAAIFIAGFTTVRWVG